jgi:hypothetical protein
MSEFRFLYFQKDAQGRMARVETLGEKPLPLNVHIDNARELGDPPEGPCRIDVSGIGMEMRVYPSEEAYRAAGLKLAPRTLIPMGAVPPKKDYPDFVESAHVLFAGKVLEAEAYPDTGPECPNCGVLLETEALRFRLYFRTEEHVEAGCVASGVAWLYGDMEMG